MKFRLTTQNIRKQLATIFFSLFFVFTIFNICANNSKILASGDLTTQQDDNPGQVLIENQDGVMYLSTETNDEVNVTGNQVQRRMKTLFTLPAGFAENLGDYINALLSFVFVVAALLVLFYLIMGAINWITSGGDKGKIENARNKITQAVIGLIIVSASYAILLLVLNFLGFEDLNHVFQNLKNIQGETVTTSSTPQARNAQFVNMCGSGNIDGEITLCNRGCSLTDKSCRSDEPFTVKYTCDDFQQECRDNRTDLSTEQTIEENIECDRTIEIDVFEKDCLDGDKNWNCTEDDLIDYFVWYSGDCGD